MKEQLKVKIEQAVEKELNHLYEIRTDLYQHPEAGGEEARSSEVLINDLKEHGFEITRDYAGIPYAFRAIKKGKTDGVTIGFFAEYDAIPNIGHGCGHNLIAAASLGAAYGLMSVLDEVDGTIVVYGTPGEENLCHKVTMTKAGAFNEATVGLMCHPYPENVASGKTVTLESIVIEFFGKSSHAGMAPELGINALDAAVLCYHEIMEKKKNFPDANIHGVFKDGGMRANVIPDHASINYFARTWSMKELKEVDEMIEECVKKAAETIGCTYRISNDVPTCNSMNSNKQISDLFDSYLLSYDDRPLEHRNLTGTTDMADVSHAIPSIHPWVGVNLKGGALHTKEFAEHTITKEGDFFIEKCAKSMALTALEVLLNEEFRTQIVKEFEKTRD